MKLDLTAEQWAWLLAVLQRLDAGETITREERRALETYQSAEYEDYLMRKLDRDAELTAFEQSYLDNVAMEFDGKRGRAGVIRGGGKSRATNRGCLGELLHRLGVLVLRAAVALVAIGLLAHYLPRACRDKPAPAPKKSAAEVVAAKAAELRAAKKTAPAPAGRSAWRVESYAGAAGERLPMLVADDLVGGGCFVVRDPAGACLVEIQAPASMPFDGPEKWRAPIMEGKRRIVGTRWIRQDARRAMLELADAAGQFDPKHGRAILNVLLADGAATIVVPYPRAGDALHGLSISLDGLADALATARRGVADL